MTSQLAVKRTAPVACSIKCNRCSLPLRGEGRAATPIAMRVSPRQLLSQCLRQLWNLRRKWGRIFPASADRKPNYPHPASPQAVQAMSTSSSRRLPPCARRAPRASLPTTTVRRAPVSTSTRRHFVPTSREEGRHVCATRSWPRWRGPWLTLVFQTRRRRATRVVQGACGVRQRGMPKEERALPAERRRLSRTRRGQIPRGPRWHQRRRGLVTSWCRWCRIWR